MYSFRSLARNLPLITGRGRLTGTEASSGAEGAHDTALTAETILFSSKSATDNPTLANHRPRTRGRLRHSYRRNLYLTPNCTVLAGAAELPRPKKGELNTPTMLVRLVWLSALNTSTVR